jgi:hypothetical protein
MKYLIKRKTSNGNGNWNIMSGGFHHPRMFPYNKRTIAMSKSEADAMVKKLKITDERAYDYELIPA